MTSPEALSNRSRMRSQSESITEDSTPAGLRRSGLEARTRDLNAFADARHHLLRDLFVTIECQRHPIVALSLTTDNLGEFRKRMDPNLQEWGISDDLRFNSIAILPQSINDLTVPTAPTPSSSSGSPSPTRPMEVDVEVPGRTHNDEELQVDATLENIIKDEETDSENEPEILTAPPVTSSPSKPRKASSPAPSSSSLSDVDPESQPIPAQLPDTVAPHQLTMYISPPRRTMADASLINPHYEHTSPYPSPPLSPALLDLKVTPQSLPSPSQLHSLVTPYAMSLYPLPPQPKKQKKKDRRSVELHRWQATIKLNPVSKWFRKSTKCLTSKEWAVGFQEKRFVQAMHHVEQLKEKGKWSLRQPKKSKGPTLTKVHWDYLLDEMRWLQVDFREERRWKLALAYDVAHTVAAWHAATSDEKAEMCVKWRHPPDQPNTVVDAPKPPEPRELQLEVRVEPDAIMEADEPSEDHPPNLEEPPDEDILPDPNPDKQIDSDSPTDQPQGIPWEAEEPTVFELPEPPTEDSDIQLIKEEAFAVDLNALRIRDQENNDADADAEMDEGGDEFKTSLVQPTDEKAAGPKVRAQRVKTLRAPFLENIGPTDAFLQLDTAMAGLSVAQLTELAEAMNISPSGEPQAETGLVGHAAIKLADLFPDLATYGPFMSITDSEKEKDKLDKRVEETPSNGKITYASRLLDVRPVLVSTLQPGKKWRMGEWEDLAELYPGDDTNTEIRPAEFYLPSPPVLFSGHKKPKEYPSFRPPTSQMTHEQMQLRVSSQQWTPEEDAQLKHLAFLYSLNWSVVADAFASWRKSISTDKRTEWDCMIRWDRMFGPASRQIAAQQEQRQNQLNSVEVDDNAPIGSRKAQRSTQSRYREPPPPTPSSPVALQAAPGQRDGPLKMSDMSRKQIRRGYMYEAIKRVVKKRDIAQANSAKNNLNPVTKTRVQANIQETHATLSGQIFSPMELSNIKLERERKSAAQLELRKAETIRLALQQQRLGIPGAPGAGKMPVSSMMSGPGQVAQIRNMQAAAQQQALQAQQQAQIQAQQGQQGQQVSSRPPSSAGSSSQQPHPTASQQGPSQQIQSQGSQSLSVPMSRVPTVAQQAMLANPNAPQMQAQLAAAAGVAMQQQQSQQSLPQMNGALSAAQIQQQQLYRSQHLTSMAAGLTPFDPSMMSGLSQDQLASLVRAQMMQQRDMMTSAHQQQVQLQQQQLQVQQQRAVASTTPVQALLQPTQNGSSPMQPLS